MRYARIAGIGSYLPKKILTNADLEKIVDTTDEWIVSRTGIRERHIVAENETASSLSENAARLALQDAGIEANEIDMILVAGVTPDRMFPYTACLLQKRLGIRYCPVFDLNAACTGFIYGLSIAEKFIRCGEMKKILIVGCEILSRIVDWTDRSTCVLFGDGAGAIILEASDEPGIIDTKLYADGKYKDLLFATNPIANPQERELSPYMQMSGNEVFKLAVKHLGSIVNYILDKNNITQDKIDWLIPHQANYRIITAIAKKLNLPMDKVVVTIAEHGNTSTASIPLAFDQAKCAGKIKRGDYLLLEGFGGGLTWGAALIKY